MSQFFITLSQVLDIFLHMDLRDFFMCGRCEFVVHHCTLLIPNAHRVAFRKALNFVLSHQYTRSKLHPYRTWKCVQGTGMGLRSSSDVANASFLHAVELCGIASLSSHVDHRTCWLQVACCWRSSRFAAVVVWELAGAHLRTSHLEK